MSTSSRLSIVRPQLRVRCPRPPPSVSPPTPVVEMMPRGHRQPERVGGVVDVAPESRRRRHARSRGRIDPDALHLREVDDEPVVADAEPGAVVPAAANREEELRSRAKSTAAITSATSTQRAMSARPPVDHRVVDRAAAIRSLASPGWMSSPRRLALRVATDASFTIVPPSTKDE